MGGATSGRRGSLERQAARLLEQLSLIACGSAGPRCGDEVRGGGGSGRARSKSRSGKRASAPRGRRGGNQSRGHERWTSALRGAEACSMQSACRPELAFTPAK